MSAQQPKQIHNPTALFDPKPYGFSHLVAVPGDAKFIFVAGQGGEENTGKLSDDFRTQIRQALNNIKIALESQNSEMNDIVKLTTLVVDYDDAKHKIQIEEFKAVWPDQQFPVNTLIPVPKLALKGMLIEIDAIAVKKHD